MKFVNLIKTFSIILFISAFSSSATVTGTAIDTRVNINSNTYYSETIRIDNSLGATNIFIAISLQNWLSNQNGNAVLEPGVVTWEGEGIYSGVGAYFVPGLKARKALTVDSTEPAIYVPAGQIVDLSIGINIPHIPSVQENGRYIGTLEFIEVP
jgi:hypothetical protein